MLCDTSFLIDLLRGKEISAKKKAEQLDAMLVHKAVSTVTVIELWRGAIKAVQSQEEKKKIEELLTSLLLYSFSEDDAKASAEIEETLSRAGAMIDLEDIMIAGTAKVRNETILTRNKKHFEKIAGLQVETY